MLLRSDTDGTTAGAEETRWLPLHASRLIERRRFPSMPLHVPTRLFLRIPQRLERYLLVVVRSKAHLSPVALAKETCGPLENLLKATDKIPDKEHRNAVITF